jgi:hypothetical protein
MKYYWFGDSWPAGKELEQVVPQDQRHLYAFPKLVSDHFGAENVVLAKTGGSADSIPFYFSQVVDQIDPAQDTVFFCLTASSFTFMLDNEGNPKTIVPRGSSHGMYHTHLNEYFNYFDSKYQRIYNYDRAVNLLYLWCQRLGIRCYFLNTISMPTEVMLDCTPDDVWLVPRNHCIAELILIYIDTDDGLIITKDPGNIVLEVWYQNQELMKQYMLGSHPNIEGHKKIAQDLIALLEAK